MNDYFHTFTILCSQILEFSHLTLTLNLKMVVMRTCSKTWSLTINASNSEGLFPRQGLSIVLDYVVLGKGSPRLGLISVWKTNPVSKILLSTNKNAVNNLKPFLLSFTLTVFCFFTRHFTTQPLPSPPPPL